MGLRSRVNDLDDVAGGYEGKNHPMTAGGAFFFAIVLAMWSAVAWCATRLFRRGR